jgi:hypothetical protein
MHFSVIERTDRGDVFRRIQDVMHVIILCFSFVCCLPNKAWG